VAKFEHGSSAPAEGEDALIPQLHVGVIVELDFDGACRFSPSVDEPTKTEGFIG
jgi:hypothetical protein